MVNFGKIDRLVIFGGTQRVVNFIRVAHGFGFTKILVVSGKRYFDQELPAESLTLREYLRKHKIPTLETDNINHFSIEKYINKATLGVSFGAPWIFSAATLNKFCGKLINAHGTDLPRNRGGGGFSWQIMSGQREGAHLFHLIDSGVDSGNIILKSKFNFPPTCREPQDYQYFFEAGEIVFFRRFFDKLSKQKSFREIRQSNNKSTYFPRLSTQQHGFINWSWQALDLLRFIQAFNHPYLGASTFINNKLVRIKGEVRCFKEGRFHPFMSGLVYRIDKGYFYVVANDQSIIFKSLYDESGQEISNKIKLGDRFYTPSKYLDESVAFKAVYDVQGLKISAHVRNG